MRRFTITLRYVSQRRISGTAEGKVVSGELEDDSFSIHFTERNENDHAKI